MAMKGYVLAFYVSALFTLNSHGQRKRTGRTLYLGADLSYVNEIQDCRGVWRDGGIAKDPYLLFAEKGCNLVRLRLWHTPEWTGYATLPDVAKSIQQAKTQKMRVLLDFHYSDTWTDPAHQAIPKAWKHIHNIALLGDSVYAYTFQTLMQLHDLNLLPDMVQVGNEINSEVLQYSDVTNTSTIDWRRNASLLNRGMDAVRDAAQKTGKPIEIMLHLAQPEEAFAWLQAASKNNLHRFQWIGLSYYPQWSKLDLAGLGEEIQRIRKRFRKRVMVVETGFPFTLTNADSARNILDTASALSGYPITKEGQKHFLIDLTRKVLHSGGEGVLYWEPAWISTACRTRWAKGSHYDNATFFDSENANEALPVFDFFRSFNY